MSDPQTAVVYLVVARQQRRSGVQEGRGLRVAGAFAQPPDSEPVGAVVVRLVVAVPQAAFDVLRAACEVEVPQVSVDAQAARS